MSKRTINRHFWFVLLTGIVLSTCAIISCWQSYFGGYATANRGISVGFNDGYVFFDMGSVAAAGEPLSTGFFGSWHGPRGFAIATTLPWRWGWDAGAAAYQYADVGGLRIRTVYIHAADFVIPLGLVAFWLHCKYAKSNRRPTAFPLDLDAH
jgi:hypothetical protein